MKVALWLVTAVALAQGSPVVAQGSPFGMSVTLKSDYSTGPGFQIDVQSGPDGPVLTRTRQQLAPDSKSGEPPRYVTQVQRIYSARCPDAVKALERLEALDLPKVQLLPKFAPDGRLLIQVPPVDGGSYTLDAPTGAQVGGRLQLSGTLRDPVGVWFVDMMKAIEPCWEN